MPVSIVSSTAQMVLSELPIGSVRGRTVEDQGACFRYASHEPPPGWVMWAGIRASGRVSGEDGAFAGL